MMTPCLLSFSFVFTLRHFDEHLRRSEDKEKLREEFLLEMPLASFSTDVDVLAETDDVVCVGHLLDHDAECTVLRPHAQELGQHQHHGQIQADDAAHVRQTPAAIVNTSIHVVANYSDPRCACHAR